MITKRTKKPGIITTKAAAEKIVKVVVEDCRVPEIIKVKESIVQGRYPLPRLSHPKTRISTVLEDPTIGNEEEEDRIGVLEGTGVGAIRVRSMEVIVRHIIMQGIMGTIHDRIIIIITITTIIEIRYIMMGRDDTYPPLGW